MPSKIIKFPAIIPTALALVPLRRASPRDAEQDQAGSGGLLRRQQLYAGCWMTGLLHMAALIIVAILEVTLRHDRGRAVAML